MVSKGRNNRFDVDPQILSLFPGMRLVVAIAHGLDNDREYSDVTAAWELAWLEAGRLDVQNAQSHPRVRALREDFKAAGVSMKRFPISIEAMLRRALKGGEPFRINPFVDLYNTLSLRHACPAGAFDPDAIDAPLQLRFTTPYDQFTALGTEAPVNVDAGEIAYACGSTVLTRHFMWRQAREALVDSSTQNVFFVSEIPGLAAKDVAQEMEHDIKWALVQYFGLSCKTFILSADSTAIEW